MIQHLDYVGKMVSQKGDKIPEKNISHIEVVGYKPYPWQMAVHNAMADSFREGKIFVCKSKRQLGKSMMCANVLLQTAFSYGRTWSAFISPTLGQARKVFREIVDACDPRLIDSKNETLLNIKFVNKAQLNFFSTQQRDALRGYTVGGILILDEAAYIDDNILELVLPWVSAKNASILIVSSPKTKSGFFYNYYMRGKSGLDDKVVSIDWNDFDTSALLTPERIEQFRAIMPKYQFRSEIMGEFVDEGSGVFNTSDKTWIEGTTMPYNELYIGVDFANGDNGDYTCVSGFNERGEQVLLNYFRDKTPLEQVGIISEIIKANQIKIRNVIAEKNSMGLTFIDMLRDKCSGVNINEFVTSNGSKREIIDALVAGIGEGSVRLMNDAEMKKEIACYQMEVTKSGLITYNGYSANDDLVMATAFAWKARTSSKGSYSISIL